MRVESPERQAVVDGVAALSLTSHVRVTCVFAGVPKAVAEESCAVAGGQEGRPEVENGVSGGESSPLMEGWTRSQASW